MVETINQGLGYAIHDHKRQVVFECRCVAIHPCLSVVTDVRNCNIW